MRQNLDELHYELAGKEKGSRETESGRAKPKKEHAQKEQSGGGGLGESGANKDNLARKNQNLGMTSDLGEICVCVMIVAR
jgi:hypothetical protein